MVGSKVFVIDSLVGRRADVCFTFSKHGIVASPLDHMSEISGDLPDRTIFWVADDGGSVREACEYSLGAARHIPVVAYKAKPEISEIVRAMRSGANDYLAYPFDDRVLESCLATIEAEWEQLILENQRRIRALAKVGRLSDREKQVLDCMTWGYANKDIAEALGISPRTVEIHRANVISKLDVPNSSAAVRTAVEAELISDKLDRTALA